MTLSQHFHAIARSVALLLGLSSMQVMAEPVPQTTENQAPSSLQQQREEKLRLLRKLERLIDAEGGSRTLIFSPYDDHPPAIRAYYDRLFKRIAEHGTKKFPTQDGRPVYGKVTLTLAFNAEGEVPRIEVEKSTSEFLSSYSQQLVRELVPFERFPAELARSKDLFVVRAPFDYGRD